jgi:dienelactone hydrolase
MQVIAFMKRNYPIDPNRIYLVGSSAGGSGAMHLASCFPDEFAAVLPLIAAGNNYPLRNFSNLPVAFHHGDRDWTSSICNARVQTQRMQALGCPTILKEYPGAGHGVPGPHEPLMTWLFEQRRNPAPETVRHDCEAPSLGRSVARTGSVSTSSTIRTGERRSKPASTTAPSRSAHRTSLHFP